MLFIIPNWTGAFDEELTFGNEFESCEIVLTTQSTAVYNHFLNSYLSEIPFLLLRGLVRQEEIRAGLSADQTSAPRRLSI